MTTRKWVQAAVLAFLLGGAAQANAEPGPIPAMQTSATYDELIASSKAAMMADPAAALARSRDAAALAAGQPAADQTVRVATAEWLQGEALMRLERVGEATPLIDRALAVVAAKAPNSALHGRLIMSKADALATAGDMRPALEHFRKALAIFRAVRDARSQAMALQNIGSIYQDAGDHRRVLQSYAEAAAVYSDDPVLAVTAFNNKGNALKALHRYAEAEAEFRRALEISRGMKSRLLEVRILTNLAATEVLADKLDAADAHILEGFRLSRTDESARAWRPFIWGVAAQAAYRRGHLQEASLFLERTFELADANATEPVYRDFHETAWRVYARLGETERAELHRDAMLRLDRQAVQLARR